MRTRIIDFRQRTQYDADKQIGKDYEKSDPEGIPKPGCIDVWDLICGCFEVSFVLIVDIPSYARRIRGSIAAYIKSTIRFTKTKTVPKKSTLNMMADTSS